MERQGNSSANTSATVKFITPPKSTPNAKCEPEATANTKPMRVVINTEATMRRLLLLGCRTDCVPPPAAFSPVRALYCSISSSEMFCQVPKRLRLCSRSASELAMSTLILSISSFLTASTSISMAIPVQKPIRLYPVHLLVHINYYWDKSNV